MPPPAPKATAARPGSEPSWPPIASRGSRARRPSSAFGALIRAAQLPQPLTNVKLHGYKVDAYWPELGVVVEVQSQFHLTKAALERDTRKAARLTAAGLTVSYVTWTQMEEEPYAVVARVAQTLTRAAEAIRFRSTPMPSISSST